MALQQIPLVGSQVLSTAIQTVLADSKLRLWVAGYNLTPQDTLANLIAAECTFSGYTSGGYPLTTWSNPIYNPSGGSSTTSPQTDVAYIGPGSGSGVTNTVGGWFLVDASGGLIADGGFDIPVPMLSDGDGFPISLAVFSGTTNLLVQCWLYGVSQ